MAVGATVGSGEAEGDTVTVGGIGSVLNWKLFKLHKLLSELVSKRKYKACFPVSIFSGSIESILVTGAIWESDFSTEIVPKSFPSV